MILGETDADATAALGQPHYWANCLDCRTTLLRPESYLAGYKPTTQYYQDYRIYQRGDE